MSIRLLEGVGVIPTSVYESNLLIHGRNMNVVASIPLPFKRKFNGPICAEVINAPNVRILNRLDDGLILVMRFDNSWTIYTEDMIPLYFGTYKGKEMLSPYILVDPFGCLSYVPKGCKKPRAYKSYLVRYKESDELHYITEGWHNGVIFTDTANPVFKKLFIEGLNAGIQHHPALSFVSNTGALYYKEYYPIYIEEMQITPEDIQALVPVYKQVSPRQYVTLTRRSRYAEVEEFLCNPAYIPDFVKEEIDCQLFDELTNAECGLPTQEVHEYMSYVMDMNPTLILAYEICGSAVAFVDYLGNVYYSAPIIYWESGHNIGESAATLRHFETGIKLAGFAVKPVSNISAPTVLPRVPVIGNKVWVHGKEIDLPVEVADRPDKTYAGYQDCVLQGKDAVIYLANGTSIII